MAPAPVASQPTSAHDEDQQGFFRPWVIRQSEANNPDTSPPVSPMTVVTQRNARKGDNGRSEASLSEHSVLAFEEVATTLVAHSIPNSAASAGNSTTLYAGASSQTFPSPQAACINGYSVSSYVERPTRRPPLQGTRHISRDGSNPRTTRLSFSSKMEHTEYLPEKANQGSKPIGQHDARLSARAASASEVLRSMRRTNAPEDFSGSDDPLLHAYKDDFDAPNRGYEKSNPRIPVTKIEKEGLYRRTKRYFGIRQKELIRSDPDSPDLRQQGTETDDVLKRVSGILKDHQERISKVLDVRTGGSSLPTAPEMPRHPQSLAKSCELGVISDPWSSRNDGMSKPPLNTPDIDAVYRGPDDQVYFKVELTARHAPTFLPSEAMKIRTPPTSPRKTKPCKVRDFFFDLDAVREGEGLAQRGAGDAQFRTAPAERYEDTDTDIDWFRVSVGFETVVDEFQLDVPDHLPNSPLCPLHPKNKSGGTGICVYHGRRSSRP